MENLILYLIKSSTLLLLFYATYFLLLKKNTFFTTNRWFLLLGIFCSILLPLLSFQKKVWVEPAISSMSTLNFQEIATNSVTNLPLIVEEAPLISWEMVIGLLYGIGVVLFLTQLLVEFYSLRKIIKNKNKIQQDGFEFIEINEAISPFSFFKKIVYNRSLFQPEELQNIIEHEKIHAKQLHSLDVLIARIHCILWWWNPLVWLYKKAIIQNLEFIADQNALAKAKDKKSYLLTLLKTSTAGKHVAITNHFYQSLIKKRIVMLHTNQSKKHHSWKYFVVLPALVFFMLNYQMEVVAQEKAKLTSRILDESAIYSMKITAESTEKELEEIKSILKKKFGVTINFKKVSRNKNGKIIIIKVSLSDKNGNAATYTTDSNNEVIEDFNVVVSTDKNGEHKFVFAAPDNQQQLMNKNIADSIAEEENKAVEKDKIIINNTIYSKLISAYSINLVLDNLKIFYKMHFDIDVKFNKITRNKDNEIIAIDVTLTNKKGVSYDYKASSANPIQPFNIFATTGETENQQFGFSKTVDSEQLKQSREVFEQNKMSSNSKQVILSVDEKDGKYKIKSTPESEVFIKEFTLEENPELLNNILIVADGKVISKEDFYKLDPNAIKSVSVVKRGSNKSADYEELFKKYGESAKNGIIDVRTTEIKKPVEKDNSGWGMDHQTSSSKDNIVLIMESKDVDYKKAFISLNGKEVSSSEMEKINPLNIGSVSIINNGNNSTFLTKYGERAKYGLILIETIDVQETVSVAEVNALASSFKIDKKNGGFTIHKRSQKGDFEFYEKYLKEIGVVAKISGIARNKEGFITAIKIKLEDENNKNKMSANWDTSRNPKGIPDISVGRKNGKLKLSSD